MIRYQARFIPPETLPPPGTHTRVQFWFTGDHTGVTANRKHITCND